MGKRGRRFTSPTWKLIDGFKLLRVCLLNSLFIRQVTLGVSLANTDEAELLNTLGKRCALARKSAPIVVNEIPCEKYLSSFLICFEIEPY